MNRILCKQFCVYYKKNTDKNKKTPSGTQVINHYNLKFKCIDNQYMKVVTKYKKNYFKSTKSAKKTMN
jgi:hypothetical protein